MIPRTTNLNRDHRSQPPIYPRCRGFASFPIGYLPFPSRTTMTPFSSCLFVSSSCERTHTLRPGLITDRLIARGIRAHNSWRPNKLSSRGRGLETFRIYTKLRTRFPPLNDCWTYLCHRVILEGECLVENAFRVHEIIKRCGNHLASSCTDYFQPKFLRPDHPPLLLET